MPANTAETYKELRLDQPFHFFLLPVAGISCGNIPV